jgi:hypothetical protein
MSSKYGDFGPGISNRGRGDREGFPPIIMGTGKATRTLVEIALLEPAIASELPVNYRRGGYRFYIQSTAVYRLYLIGLVRLHSYVPVGAARRFLHVTLNRDIPIAQELFSLTKLIGRLAGIHIVETEANLPDVPPSYPDRAFDYELLFGPRNATMTILMIALTGFADGTAISRIIGIERGNMTRLLDRIERDGIFARDIFERLAIYSLNREQPWCESLEALCLKLSEAYPHLRVLAEQALKLREDGAHYGHKFLKQYGHERQFYRRPLWEPQE